MLSISSQKLFLFSRYFSFGLDFLAIHQNGLIKSNFKLNDITNNCNTYIDIHCNTYIKIEHIFGSIV